MNTVKTYTVKPGLRLCYIKTSQFKTVTIGVHIHRQLAKGEASANALLTDVMQRGNARLQTTEAIGRYMQALYGAHFDADVRRKGQDQILSFTMHTVSDAYLPAKEGCVLKAIGTLYDMLLLPLAENGAFRADYVAQEQVNLCNDIEAMINDKRSYAIWRLIEHMCADDAYSIYELGDVESVRALTPQQLFAHYQTILSESLIDIFVTGDTDIDAILELTQRRFADVPATAAAYPVTPLYQPKGEVKTIEETYDVTQAKLSMGFYTGIAPQDPRYSALMVYNSIFGSGAHSKLFNNVREKLSLAYYASSRLERYKGIMLVSSGIEYQNKQKAEDEILVQLEAMRQGDISDYEMDVSVKSIINSLRSLGDSSGYLADYYLGQAVSGTSISLEEQCEKIAAVTKDEVVRVSQQIKPELVYVMKGEQA